MKENERLAWFNVPVNEAGEKEMEYMDYLDTPSPNIREFSFPYRYNKFLLHLYFDFNKEFNIIIDDCENERMKKEDVPKALEMAIAFKENANDDKTKEAASKLIEILSFAKEHNSLVEFFE